MDAARCTSIFYTNLKDVVHYSLLISLTFGPLPVFETQDFSLVLSMFECHITSLKKATVLLLGAIDDIFLLTV